MTLQPVSNNHLCSNENSFFNCSRIRAIFSPDTICSYFKKNPNQPANFSLGLNVLPSFAVKWISFFFDLGQFLSLTIPRKIQKMFSYHTRSVLRDVDLLIAGEVNQRNCVRRSVFRIFQPGHMTCTFNAGEAALAFLEDRLNSAEDVDIVVTNGVGRALRHFGVPVLSNLDISIWGLDNSDPSYLDEVLQRESRLENWETAGNAFPMLEPVVNWEESIENEEMRQRFMGLQQMLDQDHEYQTYQEALNAFARAVEAGNRGAAIFIRSPSSYCFSLQKNAAGEITEMAFFDSHSNPYCNSNFLLGGYVLKWRSDENANALDKAARFLTWFSPYRNNNSNYFSLTPVKLRQI